MQLSGGERLLGTVRMDTPAEDEQDAEPLLMAMRGFLVDGGKEILAFQTDPGAMVAARFTSGGR